jgi:cytochrome c-type biogenesis protein CcmH/NrfG
LESSHPIISTIFAAFRETVRIDPENALAWSGLGRAYAALKRLNDSIEAYRQAVRIDPNNASAWSHLAIVYSLSGNQMAALGAVRELRRLDPAMADEVFNLVVPR